MKTERQMIELTTRKAFGTYFNVTGILQNECVNPFYLLQNVCCTLPR